MLQMDASTRTHARVHMHMHTHTHTHSHTRASTHNTHSQTHSLTFSHRWMHSTSITSVGRGSSCSSITPTLAPSCCTPLRAHCIHIMHPIKHARTAQTAMTPAAVFSAQRASAAASECSRSGESPAGPLLLLSPCMWCFSSVCVAIVAKLMQLLQAVPRHQRFCAARLIYQLERACEKINLRVTGAIRFKLQGFLLESARRESFNLKRLHRKINVHSNSPQQASKMLQAA